MKAANSFFHSPAVLTNTIPANTISTASMNPYKLTYEIDFKGHSPNETFELEIDPNTSSLLIADTDQDNSPAWTQLECYQCENCPLSASEHPICPLANVISYYFFSDKHTASYDEVDVTVTTPDRQYYKSTTLQQAYGSILGVASALSGCPHTAFLKPMAMFHLPFSNLAETITRVISYFLLSEYYQHQKAGEKYVASLDKLVSNYQELQVVNSAVAKRIINGLKSEPAVNAVILLDILAKTIPDDIEDELNEIAYLFNSSS